MSSNVYPSNDNVKWLNEAYKKFESCAFSCNLEGTARCSLDAYPVLDCPCCNSYREKTTNTLLNHASNIEAIIRQAKADVAASIESNRIQNPDIQLMPGEPKCFVVRANAVMDGNCVLDPFYYDFDAQFDAILEKLNKQSLDTLINTLRKVVQTKMLDGRRMHPKVIDALRPLIEEN